MIYCLLVIFSPIYLLLIFSTIGIQGLMSRHRVSGLLSRQDLSLVESETTLEHDRYIDGDLLAGALDAVNLPGDSSLPLKRSSSTHTTKEYYYKTVPGKCLKEKSKPLQFDETTYKIYKNLNLLEWQKVWVYIRAFNAHGSIVCREKRFTTDGGEATIKHFIDTTQL